MTRAARAVMCALVAAACARQSAPAPPAVVRSCLPHPRAGEPEAPPIPATPVAPADPDEAPPGLAETVVTTEPTAPPDRGDEDAVARALDELVTLLTREVDAEAVRRHLAGDVTHRADDELEIASTSAHVARASILLDDRGRTIVEVELTLRRSIRVAALVRYFGKFHAWRPAFELPLSATTSIDRKGKYTVAIVVDMETMSDTLESLEGRKVLLHRSRTQR